MDGSNGTDFVVPLRGPEKKGLFYIAVSHGDERRCK